MKNFISDGKTITYTNGGSPISSGDAVLVGNMLAVAAVDIGTGETGTLRTQGVFELPAASAAVIAQGETLVWDASAGAFDDNQAVPANGDLTGPFAIAWEAKGSGATTLRVKLTGAPGTVTTGGGG